MTSSSSKMLTSKLIPTTPKKDSKSPIDRNNLELIELKTFQKPITRSFLTTEQVKAVKEQIWQDFLTSYLSFIKNYPSLGEKKVMIALINDLPADFLFAYHQGLIGKFIITGLGLVDALRRRHFSVGLREVIESILTDVFDSGRPLLKLLMDPLLQREEINRAMSLMIMSFLQTTYLRAIPENHPDTTREDAVYAGYKLCFKDLEFGQLVFKTQENHILYQQLLEQGMIKKKSFRRVLATIQEKSIVVSDGKKEKMTIGPYIKWKFTSRTACELIPSDSKIASGAKCRYKK